MPTPPPVADGSMRDSFGRAFPYLRLSITDVCNFRCTYCLPNGYQGNARADNGEEVSPVHTRHKHQSTATGEQQDRGAKVRLAQHEGGRNEDQKHRNSDPERMRYLL